LPLKKHLQIEIYLLEPTSIFVKLNSD
jgi:hypothetical protein